MAKMDPVPGGRLTLVGGVLTHRGDNDTVIKGELTNSRRAKKMTHEYLVNVKRGRAGDGQLLFIARLFTPPVFGYSAPLFDIPETAPSAGGLLRHGAGHCAANLGAGRQPLHKGAIVHQPGKGAEGDPAAHCLRRLQRVVITDVRNVVAAGQQLLAQ